jgi:hypothetical protein
MFCNFEKCHCEIERRLRRFSRVPRRPVCRHAGRVLRAITPVYGAISASPLEGPDQPRPPRPHILEHVSPHTSPKFRPRHTPSPGRAAPCALRMQHTKWPARADHLASSRSHALPLLLRKPIGPTGTHSFPCTPPALPAQAAARCSILASRATSSPPRPGPSPSQVTAGPPGRAIAGLRRAAADAQGQSAAGHLDAAGRPEPPLRVNLHQESTTSELPHIPSPSPRQLRPRTAVSELIAADGDYMASI